MPAASEAASEYNQVADVLVDGLTELVAHGEGAGDRPACKKRGDRPYADPQALCGALPPVPPQRPAEAEP